MFIVNLKKFDLFYFKGLTTGRLVYLGNGMVTTESIWEGSGIRSISSEEKNLEVVKVGRMLPIYASDLGYIEVQV